MWMNVDVPFFFTEITQFLAQRIRPSFSSSDFSLEAMAQLCMQSTGSKIQALVMFILHHVQDKLLENCCFINTSPYSCLDLHVVSFLLFPTSTSAPKVASEKFLSNLGFWFLPGWNRRYMAHSLALSYSLSCSKEATWKCELQKGQNLYIDVPAVNFPEPHSQACVMFLFPSLFWVLLSDGVSFERICIRNHIIK